MSGEGGWFSEPYERERKFVAGLNIAWIQRALWPLLAAFILLAFSDTLTTLVAMSLSAGFVELNPFASDLFRLRFGGFLLAYTLKLLPTLPLFYMVALRKREGHDDFQFRLLKFAALVVLVGGDIYLGAIVVGNNIPQLVGLFRT